MRWTRSRRRRRAADRAATPSRSGARSSRACFDGAAAGDRRRAARLQPFVAAFDLPRQAFEDVIDGVAMDLDTTRYETFDDLFEYCRRVASAVGLICIKIFGCRSARRARLRAESRRRAAADQHPARRRRTISARGRVYLPLEDLAAFGCTVDDLARRRRHRAGARGCIDVRVRAARASSTSARSPRGRPRIAGGWSPPRSCARSTSRRCSGSSAAATTCSRRARACRARARR